MTGLVSVALGIAQSQIGVREHGKNRGPEISGYCLDIGHDPEKADPWCAIFVSAMFKRAADQLGVPIPFHATAGVFTLEERAPRWAITRVPAPGAIFIKVGHAHTGIVESVGTHVVETIEGNTSAGGSSDGDGVYRRTRRFDEIMGYIDLSLPQETHA